MGFFSKIKNGLAKTRQALGDNLNGLFNRFTRIDEDLFEELEEILVTGDIGISTAQEICERLRAAVKAKGLKDPGVIREELEGIVLDMVQGDSEMHLTTAPAVVLVIGVNGVGKTTTIGKMAAYLKEQGKRVVLGAADTFRAAAIDQLQVWADRAGVTMVKSVEGTDPASVVFDTIASAKAKGADVIICDTAGRLHNKKNLMDELAKIDRVISRELPGAARENLLVLDATTGQNGVNQAKEFMQVSSLTGIVLTKLDGTAKGGVVLTIRHELGIPVKFVGVGEGLDDLQPFDAATFAEGILGTGDSV